jgi:chemotaxis regulatin CheY-phosphate phosphatase CheZ
MGDEIKAALRAGKRPENPAKEAMEQNRAEARAIWQAVEKELKATGQKDLAADVRELLREAEKPVTLRNQELYDQAKARIQDHTQARD